MSQGVEEVYPDDDLTESRGDSRRQPGVQREHGGASDTEEGPPIAPSLPEGPVLVCAADIVATEVDWVWERRVPRGKLTIISGDPGLGKSYLTLCMAAHVTTAQPWPDGATAELGAAVILTAEDGMDDTVRPRLDLLGADVHRVSLLTAVRRRGEKSEQPFSLVEDIEHLKTAIAETEAVFVVVDPVTAYLPGVDTHKASAVRSVLAPLAQMAERTGAAVVVVQHLNKGSARNALYRSGGSIDFVAAARSAMVVAGDPDDDSRRLLLSTKMNIAARPDGLAFRITASGIDWEEQPVDIDAWTALAVGSDRDDERGALSEAEEFLSDYLGPGYPVAVKSIYAEADQAGISRATLRRAKERLKVKSLRVGGLGSSGSWCWQLPLAKGCTR
jgi:RecA-family ATPase